MAPRLLFPAELDSLRFLVDAEHVREVIGQARWMRVPRATATMPGVTIWHGRAIPVCDLAACLGFSLEAAPSSRMRGLVVEVDDEVMAIPVDRAREIVSVATEAVRPPQALKVPFGEGELELNGDVAVVLDLRSLVRSLRGDVGQTE